MDRKSIKNTVGLILCLILVGTVATLITSSVLRTKRDELYSTTVTESTTTGSVIDNTEDGTDDKGPMSNVMTKETYLEEIRLREIQIEATWANVTDLTGNSAISAAKYEKGVWEEQLAKILELYLKKQSSVDTEKLRQAHANFEAEREKQSLAAAKSANEALDGLAYNKEYVKLTKEKTYEYIESYFGAN